MKNIIISNASINDTNKGCVALAYCAFGLIDQIMRENNLKYKLYLMDNLVPICDNNNFFFGNRLIEYTQIRNIQIGSAKDLVKNIINLKKSFTSYRILNKVDHILDLGQGDSFADIYGENRFNSINKSILLAQRFGIPYTFLPQTIGPFSDDSVKKKASKSINNAQFIMCRDKKSLEYVNTNFKSKNVDEYIDLAFALPYTKMEFPHSYMNVGVNISGLLWKGGYTQDNQFGLSVDYQALVKSIIEELLSRDIKVHLIPHVYSTIKGYSKENDYEVMTDLYKHYNSPNLILSPAFFDPIQAKNYISGLDLFLGARMHSDIAAFSSGVPVIPMAYSRKFNGLFNDTLHYSNMIDMKVHTNKEAIDIVKKGLENISDLRRDIEHANRNIVQPRLNKFITDLTNILI